MEDLRLIFDEWFYEDKLHKYEQRLYRYLRLTHDPDCELVIRLSYHSYDHGGEKGWVNLKLDKFCTCLVTKIRYVRSIEDKSYNSLRFERYKIGRDEPTWTYTDGSGVGESSMGGILWAMYSGGIVNFSGTLDARFGSASKYVCDSTTYSGLKMLEDPSSEKPELPDRDYARSYQCFIDMALVHRVRDRLCERTKK